MWEMPSRLPPHRRLEPLLQAASPEADLASDTLGARNRRLLALHAALSAAPLEAGLRCAHCRTENEFAVPAAAILASPVPAPGARVTLRWQGRRLSFRLPRMADLDAAAAGPGDALARIVERCRIGPDDPAPVPSALLDRLAARFEDLDPAGRIVIDLGCAECGGALRASVDIAEFVAAALDRIVAGLLREVHLLAQAYGWSEADILALPAGRRARYVAMILAAAPAAAAPAPLAVGA